MKRKIAGILLGIVMISSALFVLIDFDSENVSAYTPHAPISISGNPAFVIQAVNEGWPGDGSPGNPYIIEGYDINASTTHGIWIQSTDFHFVIRDCYVHDGGSNFRGIFFEYVISGTIEHCNLTKNSNGIYFNAVTDSVIFNNTIYQNGLEGVIVDMSSNNEIIDNKIHNNSNTGIYLPWDSNYNNIDNNTICDNSGYGVILRQFSYYNNITNNVILNSDPSAGIHLYNCMYTEISNNTVFNSKASGIELQDSSENNVTHNIVGNTTVLHGIHVLGNSNFDIIENNTIYGNAQNGIHITQSTPITVTGNMIYNNSKHGIYVNSNNNDIIENTVLSNNQTGINVSSTVNNLIYHNNIINNGLQAYDDTNNGNQWDNGYPSGGNYWSDFDEPSEGAYDDFNGPDQDILGSDGIVDNGTAAGGGKNPYVIDADSQDNYPLMGPYKKYMILKQGWNLISIPSTQQEQNLTKVLASIDGLYDAVQWYDITDKGDSWKHYKVGKPYGNDLFEINETMGFWVHIIPPGDTIFYYNGVKPAQNQKITLHPGWNLVGYPSLSNKIRTAALNNIDFGSDVDSIWTYDTATQKWKKVGPSDYFELYRGYWIHAKTECVWEVPL